MISRIFFLCLFLSFSAQSLYGAPSVKNPTKKLSAKQKKGYAFFETKIRPVLVNKCYKCHSKNSKIVQGGLLLDSRANAHKGGDSGAAVVPGDVEKSLLIESIKYEGSEMPPDGKLSKKVIQDFVQWIKMGAPDPRDGKATQLHSGIDIEAGRKFWSFSPMKKSNPPQCKNSSWCKNDIDCYILNKMESKGISPSQETSRRVLVRRLYFDIIGLPPTPEQMKEALADSSSNAIEKLVDRLLASPRFGERWGRHWLDVARFSQTNGGGTSRLYNSAWRYRDYVIASYNKDKPFDRFVREQIAGDLLPYRNNSERRENVIATAFLAMGPTTFESLDKKQLVMDVVDEQIQTVGTAFLAMTLGCARCHDHKFDPIPTNDYYALAGIFKSTRTVDSLEKSFSIWHKFPLPATPKEKEEVAQRAKKVKAAKHQLAVVTNKINSLKEQFLMTSIDDSQAIFRGDWKKKNKWKNQIGAGYRIARGSRNRVIYKFAYLDSGMYEVQVAYKAGKDRTAQAVYKIQHAKGEARKIVNQTLQPKINQQYHSLGRYQFNEKQGATISVHSTDSKKVLVADAIRLIKIPSNKTIKRKLVTLEKEERKQSRNLKPLVKFLNLAQPSIVAVTEAKKIGNTVRLIRGDIRSVGKEVSRGFLSVASIETAPRVNQKSSGRLELANWIASPKNPLTARVAVNRIWYNLFGKGLVRTVDNFGFPGEKPTHPQLLDALAIQFTQQGWSTKKIIRKIVLSRTYQLSSHSTASQKKLDPENRLHSHRKKRCVDAEALRDSILAISGQLLLNTQGQTIRRGNGRSNDTILETTYQFHEKTRSIYIPVFRNRPHDMLVAFDFPNPNASAGHRNVSVLATQSLYLMNSPFVLENAKWIAKRVLKKFPKTKKERLNFLYQLTLGRPPTATEEKQFIQFSNEQQNKGKTELETWTIISQTVLLSIDFRYLD
ncbi:FIG00929654: hypothetical protein [hydrothermal vent metagenome]|uniref:Cytochrome c domain-containing protein n=1 Tax=hydrothermal vent metagenome TaxID=652676 RepID=A0A3B1DWP1_9ZZZZ